MESPRSFGEENGGALYLELSVPVRYVIIECHNKGGLEEPIE